MGAFPPFFLDVTVLCSNCGCGFYSITQTTEAWRGEGIMGNMTGILFISNIWFYHEVNGDFQELGVSLKSSLHFRNVVGKI